MYVLFSYSIVMLFYFTGTPSPARQHARSRSVDEALHHSYTPQDVSYNPLDDNSFHLTNNGLSSTPLSFCGTATSERGVVTHNYPLTQLPSPPPPRVSSHPLPDTFPTSINVPTDVTASTTLPPSVGSHHQSSIDDTSFANSALSTEFRHFYDYTHRHLSRRDRQSLSSHTHHSHGVPSPYPQDTISMPTRAMTGESPSQYMRNRHDRRDASTRSFHERYGQRADVRGSTRHLSIHSAHAYLPYPSQAPPSRHYQSPSHYDRYDPHYRRQSHTSREGFTRTAPHVRHSDILDIQRRYDGPSPREGSTRTAPHVRFANYPGYQDNNHYDY